MSVSLSSKKAKKLPLLAKGLVIERKKKTEQCHAGSAFNVLDGACLLMRTVRSPNLIRVERDLLGDGAKVRPP